MSKIYFITALISFSSLLAFQDKKQDKPTQKEIDAAVNKGIKWLEVKLIEFFKDGAKDDPRNFFALKEELFLYTFVHADLNEKNEIFKKLLKKMLSKKPAAKQTYNLTIEIMALVSYDPIRFQDRIAECVQALVDRQCKNGQWSYKGTHVVDDKDIDEIPTDTNKNKLKKIVIKRNHWGQESGDNSNSQYAALALRACYEAEIHVEKQVLKLAKECWEKSQNQDGGWDYHYKENNWKGTDQVDKEPKYLTTSYGSMTVGGLSSLAGYKYMLKEDTKKDIHIKKGIEWITKNFSVEKNPKIPDDRSYGGWLYYFLYGLERAGALVDVEKFGSHDWYNKGAKYILKHQQKDGHWSGLVDKSAVEMKGDYMGSIDTCFAILFLKRATTHLLETGK